MLQNYVGVLQNDGYSVYERMFANHLHIMLVYCMAHARRKFVDALQDNKEKASYVLERMQVLYVLEEHLREQVWTGSNEQRSDKKKRHRYSRSWAPG